MRARSAVLAVAVTGLLLSGCGSGDDEPITTGESAAPATSAATPTPSTSASDSGAAVDPASVKANELGKVPVLMYHQVKTDAKDVYDQTPAEFKAELQRMYDADFRPITAQNFVSGKIDIPGGMHPVVLTFDDSSVSQAKIGADGSPAPDTALGIMEQFGKDNPDWKSTATFYVNTEPAPFLDDKVMPWLVENGYEIGSHTVSHANLGKLSDAAVQKEIGENVAAIEKAVPGYKVTTFCRPFGVAPQNGKLQVSGSYEGTDYSLKAVMLVGANPSKSAFASDFDPIFVSRIRSGPKSKPVDTDSTFWLNLLDKGQWTPYTSDGNPDTISYPASSSVKIASTYQDKANAYSASGSSTGGATSAPGSTATPAATATPSATAGSTASATPSS